MTNKEVIYTTDKGFADLVKEYKATFILKSQGFLVAVSDGAYVVLSLQTIMSSIIKNVSRILRSNNGYNCHQNNFNTNDGDVRIDIGSKANLVKALVAFGIDEKMVSKLKTVRASELRELIDQSPVKADETEEVSEILLRLTQKNDKVEFVTKVPALPKIVVKFDARHGGGPGYYTIEGNMKPYMDKVVDFLCRSIGLPVYPGCPTAVQGNMMHNAFDGEE